MQQLPKRLLSIDVLRAITMLLMIFVNDASDVQHVPLWIDHAKASEDALGFADTIFPAFLFIVGLSLPFAINNRIKKGDKTISILYYILTRSIALLVMGFYHVNLEEYNPAGAVLSRPVWALIITVAFFLIWLDYPETMSKVKKNIFMGSGVAMLIAMAIVYQGGTPAHPEGMHPSWWGILGIIGWTYLVCSLIYFLCRGRLVVLIVCWVAFIVLNLIIHIIWNNGRIWIIGDGASVALTMGGIIVSQVYAYLVKQDKAARLWSILLVTGILTIAAGLLIRPYSGGISKIHSTPAWVFICTGITTLAFELCIYLIDVKGKKDWFSLIKPAGTSTLTCYLMPYFQVYLLRLFHINYPPAFYQGILGLLRSVIISLFLIWLVGLMEKKRLRLKV